MTASKDSSSSPRRSCGFSRRDKQHSSALGGSPIRSMPRYAALVLMICAGLAGWGRGADAVYADLSADQFLKEWLLLGPIPVRESGASPDSGTSPDAPDDLVSDLTRDLLASAGGESMAKPESGQTLEIHGHDYNWKLHAAATDTVDLIEVFGEHERAIAYAAVKIESTGAQSRLVGLGSDDAIRVWLNGELVHENDTSRALRVDDDIFSIDLREGTNYLLLKVRNDQGAWGFAVRFLSPEITARRLFRAASSGDVDTIKKLADLGVDLNVPSPAGIRAAQVAKMRGYDHVAEMLIAKGSDPVGPFDADLVVPALLAQIGSDDAPGVAVLVARDGTVMLSHALGMADLSHDVPITPTTKFRIGSITKQFAAAAILKLQEEGILSVNDKLAKFLPDFPRGDEVTIHQLLTHTSGIKSYTSKPDFLASIGSPANNDEVVESFKNEPFDFDPGSNFAYNNSGYFLLGIIIEKVSGKSFDSYLRDTFFEPLEMRDTGMHTATAVLKREATGYEYRDGKVTRAIHWDMSRAGAAGGLYSTVEDLMRWNEALFGGKVLSEESLQAAFTPVKLNSDQPPTLAYGYGFIMGERRGLKTISHGGGLNGWSSNLTRYVDQNATIVVLHNGLPVMPGLAPGEVAELAADAFLWQEMKPRPRYEVDESVNPETFAAYVGRYDYQGAVMDVALEGKQLTAQLTGQPRFPIFPLGESRFFWKVVDAQIEFLKDNDGVVDSARHTQSGVTFVAKRLVDEKVVDVEVEALDRYTGKYSYPGIGVLTIRRDGGRLLAQMTGQPEFELYAKASDVFFWKVVPAEVKFVLGDDGMVEKLIHQQSGVTIEAKKSE